MSKECQRTRMAILFMSSKNFIDKVSFEQNPEITEGTSYAYVSCDNRGRGMLGVFIVQLNLPKQIRQIH